MTHSIEDVVEAYMKLRNKRDAIANKMKAEIAGIEEKIGLLEAFLLSQMAVQGVDTYRTKFGTAMRVTKDYVTVSDWDEVLEYVKNNDAYELLERRVKKEAVKAIMDEGKPPPPGVDYTTKVDITIRKPPNKAS